MARKKKGARVLGPYPDKGGWRVIAIDEEGNRAVGWHATKAEAIEVAEEAQRLNPYRPPIVVGDAIDQYGEYLRRKLAKNRARNGRSKSVTTTTSRLKNFVGKENLDMGLRGVSTAFLRERIIRRDEVVAFDTLAGDFGAARRWLRWCHTKGWISSATLGALDGLARMEELEGVHNRGKPQLRIDEARKLRDVLMEQDSQAATAVLCLLLLGLRSGEVLQRVVRDLDDDGWLLHIKRGKTARSNRKVKLIPELRGRLLELAEGREPGDPLFPARKRSGERLKGGGFHHNDWLRCQVHRFCDLAGVPLRCPHGLRGTHASLAESAGATAEVVAAALGHTSPKVTHDHYTMPNAVDEARQRRTLTVLAGGRG